MALVVPFQAVRPHRNKIHLVASRAFYTYKKNVLQAKLESNQYSFIHIINPEFNEDKTERTESNSVERFLKVRSKYDQFKLESTLKKDDKPSFYIYQQKGEHAFTGIIGGASVEDYNKDVIKKHEDTLTNREQVFKTYLDVCEFNAEPVLMMHEDNQSLASVIESYTNSRPEYEFTTTDDVVHNLWVVENVSHIDQISKAFEAIPKLYIADGHHRSASSAILGNERKKNHGNEQASDQFFMTYFLPESELKIFEFNRLIKDLNGHTKHSFMDALSLHFDLKENSQSVLKPASPGEFCLYLEDEWFRYAFKTPNHSDDPVKSLDAQILSDYVLDPILDIKDLKTSERIHFEGGPNGVNRMISLVDEGKYKAAFSLFPVTIDQLKSVADHGLTMPPKSTWVEPKLRSGLTIYEF